MPGATAPGRISSDLVRPSADPVRLGENTRPLNVSYAYGGRTYTLDDYLRRSDTRGFVVLDARNPDGRNPGEPDIVAEHYAAGASRDTRFQSWSMAKSFTSAAVGIALGEGRIRSLDDPVTRYLPELRRSGYDGVSIRNVLRMSSGIAWDEERDVARLQVAASAGRSLARAAARQVRGWA
ncbi:MAG: beta-lactamase family protein, partial [Nocardiopsaceae bacterium]|nr:beta-lactamase family protein [Nocardiopsaceae bacterium]